MQTVTATTTDDTYHGNPGERLLLPSGTRVYLRPTSNLPDNHWWAEPIDPASVSPEILNWAYGPGLLLHHGDVLLDF